MYIKRFLAVGLILAAIVVAVPVLGYATDDTDDWTVYFRPAIRFGTDDRTLYIMDFLVPLYRGEKNVLFFNPKFTPNDQDGWETNLGLGYRHLLLDDRLILGANVFYDTRRTGWGTYWDQVGFGAEAMTELNKYVALTGRFNYYIPLTDPIVEGTTGGVFFTSPTFQGYGVFIGGEGGGGWTVEEAPEGFDAELGFRVPFLSDYVETWVYGGGYHYKGKYVDDIDGWSARLEVIPTDFLRVSYDYREDRTNQGEHHGEVAIEIPFSVGNLFTGKNPFEGFGKHLGGSRDMKERLVEPVRRDVDIRVETEEIAGGGTGTGAGETELLGVVFVDELGVAGGDGSFEHPFASIQEAMDAINSGGVYAGITTIHVMNDDTTGTLSAGGGVLNLAALMIWGSGMPHPTLGYISNQFLGNPTVGNDLTLDVGADGVEVFGADYTSANGVTVIGANANIHDNYFTNNANCGVYVDGGSADIFGNYFSGGSLGIGVTAGGSATITDNFIGGGAPGLSPLTYAGIVMNDGTIDSIAGNTITVNSLAGGDGIYFNGVSSIDGLVISGNIISLYNTAGSDAGGIVFVNCGDITDTEITSNTISAEGDGGFTGGIAAVFGSGDYDLDISDNRITVPDAGGDAGGITLSTDGSITADIHDNPLISVTNAGGDAGGIVLSAGGDITADVHDNPSITVATSVGDAAGIVLDADDSVYARIIANDLGGGIFGAGSSEGVYGIALYANSGDILGIGGGSLLISGNNLGGAGIRATGAGYDAYGIYLDAAGDIGALGTHALISDNAGIDVASFDGWAAGIYASATDILADVTNNDDMTVVAGDGYGFGVWLIAGRYVGATVAAPDPILVSGNDNMTVSSPNANGYGIALYGMDYVLAGITDNTNMTVSGRGDQPVLLTPGTGNAGIAAISPGGSLGFAGPGTGLLVSGNTMTVNSDFDGIGILAFANNTIEAETAYGGGILNNTVAVNSTGGNGAGILLDGWDIYGDIAGNGLTTVATNGEADGILGYAADYLAASVTGGSITAEGYEAYGVALGTDGDSGAIDLDADISVPTIHVTGGDFGAIGIELYADNGSIDASVTDTNITADLEASAIDGWADGIYAYAGRYLNASVSGGSISATGFGANGIYAETYGDNGSGLGLNADISVPTITATGDTYGAAGIYLDTYNADANVQIDDTNITAVSLHNYATGIYAGVDNYLGAAISGGSIDVIGFNATGIYLEAYGTGMYADISVPTFGVGSTSDNSAGIHLYADAGYIDTAIYGITNMKVTSLGSLPVGIMAEAAGDIIGYISHNTMTVEGVGTGGGMYPTGVSLQAGNDLGQTSAPFVIYDNDLTVTNMDWSAIPTGEAYGLTINLLSLPSFGGTVSHDVYTEIYGNSLTVTGIADAGGSGWGVIGGIIVANNLIGSNFAGTLVPTIVSDNDLTLNSDVPCLALYFNSIGSATSPGIGNYLNFSAYGANAITAPNGLADPNGLGYFGLETNFPWGYPVGFGGIGVPANGFDFIQP